MPVYQSQTLDAECAAAFKSVRAAKNVFMILTLLAILAVPFATVMATYGGVLDAGANAAPATASTTAPATALATSPSAAPAAPAEQMRRAAVWRYTLDIMLTVAGVVAPPLALLAVITIFFGANLSLINRCGGVAGFLGAFFWSILLLVMILPWQNIMPGTLTSGILAGMDQILDQASALKGADTNGRLLFFARFLAYPAVALLVWIMVMVKFARGYNAMNASTSVGAAGQTPPAADQQRPAQPMAKL